MRTSSEISPRRRPWLRVGLIGLALPNAVVGAWAVLAPRSFYDDFPAAGRHWVSALPPFNEHLTTDVGAWALGLMTVLLLAAYFCERRLVQVALVAAAVQATPHFVYHLGTLDSYETGDAIASQVALGLTVFVPLLLLPLTRPPAPAEAPRTERAPTGAAHS